MAIGPATEIPLVVTKRIRLGAVMTRFKMIETSSTEGCVSGIRIQIPVRIRVASEKTVMAVKQKEKRNIMFLMMMRGKSRYSREKLR